jgi:hypothetical protein
MPEKDREWINKNTEGENIGKKGHGKFTAENAAELPCCCQQPWK